MAMDIIEKLKTHPDFITCLEEIEKFEHKRIFCKHDMPHFIEVGKIMEMENEKEDLGYSREVIWAASLLHDLGKSVQYKDETPHHIAGQEIARTILRECDYSDSDIEDICKAIKEHSGFDKKMGLSELLRKSDKLSRRCFECKAYKDCKWPIERRNKRSYI